MHNIEELKRQGLSVTAIASVTGFDRKTIRKYLAQPDLLPRYRPRSTKPSLLKPFRSYLEQRLAAGVWNAVVLLRELRERGYQGGYTIWKDYLQPKREEAGAVAVRPAPRLQVGGFVAGMMITSNHYAQMSTRNTANCMGQGQAIGAAAALCAAKNCGTGDLAYADLRRTLAKDNV